MQTNLFVVFVVVIFFLAIYLWSYPIKALFEKRKGESEINKNGYNSWGVIFVLSCFFLSIYLWTHPIQAYFKKSTIKSHANVVNISEVYVACEPYKTKNDVEKCNQKISDYRYLEEPFNAMIDHIDEINCNNFSDKKEARYFYEYIGGLNIINNIALFERRGADAIKTLLVEEKSTYDPYDLDADNDGIPCEELRDE